jgi:basic membrane protein A
MLKRVDVAVYETISEHRAGAFQSGVRVFDVANDGVGYSDTGGHVVAIQEQLGGSIVVPRMP